MFMHHAYSILWHEISEVDKYEFQLRRKGHIPGERSLRQAHYVLEPEKVNYLTKSMDQNPLSGADSRSADQGIFRPLWNPKFLYRVDVDFLGKRRVTCT
jgi:hypothetical protein